MAHRGKDLAFLVAGLGGAVAIIGLALFLGWRSRRRNRHPFQPLSPGAHRKKSHLSKQEQRKRADARKRH
ncbi:hypothetical protein [Azohydromonas lata]|uniref:hypothetical protein n=1 Tax=Azohydromonas lata TaxID=45677 RepID=UPI0012F52AC6|nr:hypothetical protein [Azohydromonas lata]